MFDLLRLRPNWASVPSQCAVCHGWPAQCLCSACLTRFAHVQPRCRTCADVVPDGVTQCGACLSHGTALQSCHAAVTYGYPWAQMVTAFKFHGDTGWAHTLADIMRHMLGTHQLAWDEVDVILPIALSAQRLRQRGFNQALVLAQALVAAYKVDTHMDAYVDAHTLVRLHDTCAQTQLTRHERLHNLQTAFALHPMRAQRIRGQRVLLVDDVMTTGATLQAAATVLHEGAAQHVHAVVFARTPRT